MADLAVAERPVITLVEATGGDLTLSRCPREIHPLINSANELRVVFCSGGATWGCACISRAADEPDFSPEDQDLLASVAEDIGGALRLALQLTTRRRSTRRPARCPASSSSARTTRSSRRGRRPMAGSRSSASSGSTACRRPSTASCASLERWPRASPCPGRRGRIRLASGVWLMIRATVLRGRDGEQPRIAVVLEPARRAELATLMVMIYDLSAREREVTELLLRGLPIDAIAADLAISRHTVRDHTKAIFGKLGVTSRPELTAKLYHEHALPEMRLTA